MRRGASTGAPDSSVRTSVAPSLSDTSTVLTASSVRDGTDTSVSGRRAAVERIPAEPVWLPLPARR
ncbi:hypothetical protein RE9431_45400 [Prescottella equi]|nr:hypothetical protein H849_22732 [Prescottella equi NBRC 101255 = C 7]BCN61132.1 hypothetical protein RE9427_45020 [Prescottella equi]BCN66085.1 hypothetical protein RE9431_45400 [Prescottella equi]BCN75923.1 hypothetical protein RE0327_45220 [Prescottella equi]BCN85929.1 hypothetical protein RE0356_45700 [Prescottella equi]